MNDPNKDNKDVEIPEPIVKVLKSIASSLAESLTEIKERLFALEIEVKTLGSRVDSLEEQLSRSNLNVETSPKGHSLLETRAVIKSSNVPPSSISSMNSSISGDSPSPRSTSLEPSTSSNMSTTEASPRSPLSQSLPAPSKNVPKRPVRPIVAASSTHKEDKKREKEELLKALKLIDTL